MVEAKNYLVGGALAISLGINGLLLGAGLASATTIPTTIAGVIHKEVSQSAVSSWRTTAATDTCAKSAEELGLDVGDCSAENVATISVQFLDEHGVLLDKAKAAVRYIYPVDAVLR